MIGVLLVDTYNVLHVTGVLPPELAGLEPMGLAELIARSRYRAREARLVCDGVKERATADEDAAGVPVDAPRRQVTDRLRGKGAKGGRRGGAGVSEPVAGPAAGGLGRCAIVYAGAGREADDEIERILAAHSAARRVLVVSSDRRLRRAAGRAGADWIDAPRFLAQLVHDAGAGRGASLSARPAFAEEVPLDGASVGHWLREFGPGAQALIEAAGRERAARASRPRTPTPKSSPPPRATPPTRAPKRAGSGPPPEPPLPRGPAPIDEGLRRLLEEEWRGAVSPDDLEMQ